MTKLRYVGTYAQEFPGPDDTVVMVGPGEFLEDADTEDEAIKASMESGDLIPADGSHEEEGFVYEDNVPDEAAPASQAQIAAEKVEAQQQKESAPTDTGE
jgi:hypothetical protein